MIVFEFLQGAIGFFPSTCVNASCLYYIIFMCQRTMRSSGEINLLCFFLRHHYKYCPVDLLYGALLVPYLGASRSERGRFIRFTSSAFRHVWLVFNSSGSRIKLFILLSTPVGDCIFLKMIVQGKFYDVKTNKEKNRFNISISFGASSS